MGDGTTTDQLFPITSSLRDVVNIGAAYETSYAIFGLFIIY